MLEEESKKEGEEEVQDEKAAAGEHFHINFSFLKLPDATHVSSQASLSSLHLQAKQVGKKDSSKAQDGGRRASSYHWSVVTGKKTVHGRRSSYPVYRGGTGQKMIFPGQKSPFQKNVP